MKLKLKIKTRNKDCDDDVCSIKECYSYAFINDHTLNRFNREVRYCYDHWEEICDNEGIKK